MITRLHVDNYKTLSNFEWRPARVNLLLGENGSGKSSVFEVIRGLRDILVQDEDVSEAFPNETLTRWVNGASVQRVEIDIQVKQARYGYLLDIEHERLFATSRIAREQLLFNEKPIFRYEKGTVQLFNNDHTPGPSFPFAGKISFLGQMEPRKEDWQLAEFKEFLFHLWIVRPIPDGIEATSDEEDESLDEDCSNFSSWLRHLFQEQPDSLAELTASLKGPIVGLQSIKLAKIGEEARELVLVMRHVVDDATTNYSLSFEELSDGQKILIVLYALRVFQVRRGRTLFLDEPDNFIALQEIQPFLRELSLSAEEDDVQLILASHNPEVVDYLACDASILSRPSGGETRIGTLEIDRTLGIRASEWIARRLHADAE